jgi:hypothetical protein
MAAALPLIHAEGIFADGVGGRAPIRLLLDGFLEKETGLLVFVIAALLYRAVQVPRSLVRH